MTGERKPTLIARVPFALVVHAIWVLTVGFGEVDIVVGNDWACWCIGWKVDHWVGGKR